MVTYKIELFTDKESFSGVYNFTSDNETENHDSILKGLYRGFNEGLIPLVTRRTDTIDEIVYVPRDNVHHIRITYLKYPDSGV